MNVRIFSSTVADGSMKSSKGDYRETISARRGFLDKHGIPADEAVLLRVAYEGDDYCRYVSVDDKYSGEGITRPATIVSDALFTQTENLALFLPLADCAPLVIYDEASSAVMLSHLGRHSVEQGGGRKSVEYYLQETGVSPASLRLWLGPAAGVESYPIWALEGKGLHEAILEQLESAGIERSQIDFTPVDTTKDPSYYSHSNYLKGLQDSDGRFAVVAVIER